MIPKDSEETEEQNTKQSEPQMQAPRAASERDVEEAERKVEELRGALEAAQAEFRAEVEELRDEIAEHEEVIERLDLLVNKVYELGATKSGEPSLNEDMPYQAPGNKEKEESASYFFEIPGDHDE